MKNRKGISPVIATIIMVAVAIVISIAAAFWLTGLMGAFTTYENIRIMAYASRSGNSYTINVTINNVGSTNVTINKILIEGGMKGNITPSLPNFVNPGDSKTFSITGYITNDFPPGRTVRVTVITARESYEGQLTLP
ncbi:MAG: archaellin/type IV pilin N-terminal domain-containing protein [Candidatus Methanomethylicia archaeon]